MILYGLPIFVTSICDQGEEKQVPIRSPTVTGTKKERTIPFKKDSASRDQNASSCVCRRERILWSQRFQRQQ